MRGLLELLRRAAILPQQMFQDRLIAPVRIEEIPVRVLRALELRHMREFEQSIHHRQRRMANTQSALGLSGVRLPRNHRAAIGALKAALSLVRVHRAAAVLTFNGKHLVHGNVLLCTKLSTLSMSSKQAHAHTHVAQNGPPRQTRRLAR